MTEKSPGARAIDACQIDDVFLVSASCWVAKDTNPQAPVADFTFGVKSGIEQEALVQERSPLNGGDSFHVLRYFITTKVRILRPGVVPSSENIIQEDPGSESVLAELKLIVAADYRCPKSFLQDQDAIGAFSRNAHFHAWPYIRETVHAMCSRLRVPRATLQMLKPDQVSAPKEIRTVEAQEQHL